MAFIAWSPAFSVNIKQFDDQHKKLVVMINELHDAMIEGRGKETLGEILNELITYTATHFADEEALMVKYTYSDLANHNAIHESLVNQVLELQQMFISGQTIITLDVINFLRDWLVMHIQGDDKKYGAYLNSKGVV